MWNNEVAFLVDPAGQKLISALAALNGDLANVAQSAWSALANAVSSAFGAVASWFAGVPARIVSALGNVGNILCDAAGKAILTGFLNGIKAAFNDVHQLHRRHRQLDRDLSHKGPIGADATLLVPHGNAICMQGLAQADSSRASRRRSSR